MCTVLEIILGSYICIRTWYDGYNRINVLASSYVLVHSEQVQALVNAKPTSCHATIFIPLTHRMYHALIDLLATDTGENNGMVLMVIDNSLRTEYTISRS